IQPFGHVDAAWQLLLHTDADTGEFHAIHRYDKHDRTPGLPTHKNIRGTPGGAETPDNQPPPGTEGEFVRQEVLRAANFVISLEQGLEDWIRELSIDVGEAFSSHETLLDALALEDVRDAAMSVGDEEFTRLATLLGSYLMASARVRIYTERSRALGVEERRAV